MAEVFISIWFGLSALIGYGAAFLFSCVILDIPKNMSFIETTFYIIGWFIIGMILSIAAAFTVPFLTLIAVALFVMERYKRKKKH